MLTNRTFNGHLALIICGTAAAMATAGRLPQASNGHICLFFIKAWGWAFRMINGYFQGWLPKESSGCGFTMRRREQLFTMALKKPCVCKRPLRWMVNSKSACCSAKGCRTGDGYQFPGQLLIRTSPNKLDTQGTNFDTHPKEKSTKLKNRDILLF